MKIHSAIRLFVVTYGVLSLMQGCYGWDWPWAVAVKKATSAKPETTVTFAESPLIVEDSCPEFTMSSDDEQAVEDVLQAPPTSPSSAKTPKKKSEWHFNRKRGLFLSTVSIVALATLYASHSTEANSWEATKKDLKAPFSWISQKMQSQRLTDKAKGVAGILLLGCCAELIASYLFDYNSVVASNLHTVKNYLP